MTEQFSFHLPTRVEWRTPAEEGLAEEVAALAAERILIVTDPGVAAAGLVEPLRDRLELNRATVEVHTDVSSNPTTTDVASAQRAARDSEADLVVALGGGSAIDTAKATAMLLANGGEYTDYQWDGRPITTRSHPFVAVPTTAGTGSEVSRVSVISDPTQPFKKGVVSPLMAPSVALIDPELTVGLPAPVTAATGIDAFVHSLEAFTGLRTNPFSDTLALESIRLAYAHLGRATADGSDREARAAMMKAAVFGGIAMDQAGLGLVHALSGGICSHLHLHHGAANAMILPFAAEFNAGALETGRQAQLNLALGLPARAPGEEVVAVLRSFVESLDLPIGLGHLDLDEDQVPWAEIADESMRMVMMSNNPRAVTVADCLSILAAMR